MRQFFFRLLITSFTVLLTSLLLPGFTVAGNSIWNYLALGLILGLVNAFVRPLVILAFGKVIIRTMGLFLIVINSLMLLLIYGAQDLFGFELIGFNNWFTVFLAGMFIGVIGAVLDILFGLNRPAVSDREDNELLWAWIDNLPAFRRSRIVENLRIQEVFDTMWSYGLNIAFSGGVIGTMRSSIGGFLSPGDPGLEELNTPAKVRLMLQQLGPTYVKIGQIISSRAEALPPEWKSELSRLQSEVAPFPVDEAYEIIEDELGAQADEIYSVFDPEPIAAASTAQIHKAVTQGRDDVVVKVQRPYIQPIVKADLGIMGDTIGTLESNFSWARNSDLSGIFRNFADNVVLELDYRNEAYNARRLKANMALYPQVKVPTIYSELSTDRVLTMEFVHGVKITDVDALDAAGLDRKATAEIFVRAFLKQWLFDGFFHADPHPGNILVNTQTGDVIFIDLGMMGVLDRAQRMDLIDLMWSIQMADSEGLASVLMRLSVPFRDDIDVAKLRSSIDEMTNRYLIYGERGGSIGGVMNESINVMYEAGFRINQSLTLAIKAITQAEEIVSTLDPEMHLLALANREVATLVKGQLNADTVTEIAKQQAVRTAREAIRRMPSLSEATVSWLDQYQKGRFEVTVNTDQLTRELREFNRRVSALAVALVLGGLLIGTSIATFIEANFLGVRLNQIAFGVFMLSVIVSLVWIWRFSRALRK
jgi:ubiquinone biosynthesis protein